ncbi:MAG: c-type cytochrome [Acidimicrobiia bacterium]
MTARGRLTVILVTFATLVAAIALTACGGGSDAPDAATPPKPTGTLAGDAQLLEGRRVYTKYCSACHGVDGSGGPGKPFTGGRLLKSQPTPADELALVRKGLGVMPSFGETLTPEQLDAVVRYTREVLAPRPAGR